MEEHKNIVVTVIDYNSNAVAFIRLSDEDENVLEEKYSENGEEFFSNYFVRKYGFKSSECAYMFSDEMPEITIKQ